ncbi:hypothetical protein C7C56_000330 [Massilia glaciei]|uniref:Uncharacterized protein n=1 Tax=Massilia glaciei TaxID=1524097 RepID=A0A2U2I7L0_9BURK|nr:hypothetical protein C7C56_000330 [Massilia glaciei]
MKDGETLPPGQQTDAVTEPTGSSRDLPKRLLDAGYHPVLLFGTSTSGKSCILSSLMSYLRTTPHASISFGDGVIKTDSEYGRRQLMRAQFLFNRSVLEFIAGKANDATQDEPFYVPVVVTPANGLPQVKFAFLESMGELYKPAPKTHEYFKAPPSEVSDVMQQFHQAISVIYVAPFAINQGYVYDNNTPDDGAARREADLGLVGTIKAYEKMRTAKGKDHHLYLLSKWDLYTHEKCADTEFYAPTPGSIHKLLGERFNQSWSAYQAMPLGVASDRRNYMQYCSGLIGGKNILGVDDEIKKIIDRYPRTLWNWLYQNATTKDGVPGPPLFHDVLPRIPRKPTLSERILGVK